MRISRPTPATVLLCVVAGGLTLTLVTVVQAQRGGPMTKEVRAKRESTEAELEEIAIIDRKVMVPMRDGKRMATDIYRPKDTSKKYPIIFVRTPYNFNFWDVRNGVWRDMGTELAAVKLEFRSPAEKLSDPVPESNAANSLSLGEFTRVNTFPEAGPESSGKT